MYKAFLLVHSHHIEELISALSLINVQKLSINC